MSISGPGRLRPCRCAVVLGLRTLVLAELTGLLSEQPPGRGPVVLVASSGAGKSSLLRAGLMPALDRGVLPQAGSRRWPRLLFTPTAHPLAALSAQLSPVIGIAPEHVSAALAENPGCVAELIRNAVSAGQVPGDGVAVVVDQLEEAFALCDDERERAVSSRRCAPWDRWPILLAVW